MNGNALTHDDMIDTGIHLSRILKATPLEGRKVRVAFDNGLEKIVDLAPALNSFRIYIPLREDDVLFRSLRISEYGDAIEWNDELDFSAMWLERLPDISFSNEDFRQTMDKLGITLDGMATALEISRRQVASYRKDKPIPRHIAYAARYLVEHQEQSPLSLHQWHFSNHRRGATVAISHPLWHHWHDGLPLQFLNNRW